MTRNDGGRFAGFTDEELAQALKSGQDSAFDEIVHRYQGRVYAVAFRVTGSREDALDVAQDVFVKAYQKIHSWRPTGEFQSWLLRLTSNQAIDLLRRRKRRRTEQLEQAAPAEQRRSGATGTVVAVETELNAREIEERIQLALEVLSPSQKTVFVLRHYEGLQLSDIAKVVGCTVGSVKVHLFRALKKLQKELGDFYEEMGQ